MSQGAVNDCRCVLGEDIDDFGKSCDWKMLKRSKVSCFTSKKPNLEGMNVMIHTISKPKEPSTIMMSTTRSAIFPIVCQSYH